MLDKDPAKTIRRLLEKCDEPIRRRDAIERARDMERRAMRAERDQDFEVTDDLEDVDTALHFEDEDEFEVF